VKFYYFTTQEERRSFGGSCFVEIQFCRIKPTAKVKQIVAVSSIEHWQNDSLYVYEDDINSFYDEYSDIFDCGTYNNLHSGKIDVHGINYYQADLINVIITKIQAAKASDCETIIAWLNKAKGYNGFYILGI